MTDYIPLKGTLAVLVNSYAEQAGAASLAMSRIMIEGIETGFLESYLTTTDGRLYDLEKTVRLLRAEIDRVLPHARRLDAHALGLAA